VTEAGAFEAIVETLGVDRLLYGSDLPVSHLRGRAVALGDSFLWLSAGNTDYSAWYGDVLPVLVGLESLRALKLGCRRLRLSDSQIEKIFYRNAVELYV
jgi:predicted TIM-barrel fold metal-dependent hydrolase